MIRVQLADCFVDAIINEEVKKDVLRVSLKTVAEAVLAARTTESQLERMRKKRCQSGGRGANQNSCGGIDPLLLTP